MPGKRREHRVNARRNGHSFSTVEPEPDGIDVADHRGGTAGRDGDRAATCDTGQQDGQHSLRNIERHGGDAAPWAGRPQDVRRAHVAAAGTPNVDPDSPRQQIGTGTSPQDSRDDGKHQVNARRRSGRTILATGGCETA
jgi:hypothetical protein